MAQPSIRFKGLTGLIAKVDKLSNVDMTKGVAKATALIQGSAKMKAPKDKGILQGSISKRVEQSVGGVTKGYVFTNLEYAPYVEFGTGAKGQGTYKYNPKGVDLTYRQTPWAFEGEDGETIWTNGQVAQPFMFPALRENKKAVKKILETEYEKIISQGVA